MMNKKELRKVLVRFAYHQSQRYKNIEGLFHGFYDMVDREGKPYPHAIVELMDGKVIFAGADDISFIDKPCSNAGNISHPLLGRKVVFEKSGPAPGWTGDLFGTGIITRVNGDNKSGTVTIQGDNIEIYAQFTGDKFFNMNGVKINLWKE
jgi:hypothetical protein